MGRAARVVGSEWRFGILEMTALYSCWIQCWDVSGRLMNEAMLYGGSGDGVDGPVRSRWMGERTS